MKYPLVSLIVPTKNSAEFIESCLKSCLNQEYPKKELIVVDNNSSDKTKEIAKKFTKLVFNKGPERSAQRNFGATKAKGEYVFFIDSDMILTPKVVKACVEVIVKRKVGGVIIPEESFGVGFWAQAKALERECYIGNDAIEAARFFSKKVFKELGGFDLSLTGPEDWDLSQRVSYKHKLARISEFIRHNEGELSLLKTLQKKYYYSKKFSVYLEKREHESTQQQQFSVINRYKILVSQPKKLIKTPLLSIGMLFMKTAEFAAGGLGYLSFKAKQN